MKQDNCIKTSFITAFGLYCYVTRPFGLNNAGATYRRTMQRSLHTQLGRNVEAYVDDVVIKTQLKEDLIADLEETFNNLRAFKKKLNPEKCTFSVPSMKLLGFLVSKHRIEANPGKIAAIHSMEPSSAIKKLQKLTGCMVSLSRFTSRLGELDMLFILSFKSLASCLFSAAPNSMVAWAAAQKLTSGYKAGTKPIRAKPR